MADVVTGKLWKVSDIVAMLAHGSWLSAGLEIRGPAIRNRGGQSMSVCKGDEFDRIFESESKQALD
jgi:hypothetical protein